MTVQYSVVPKKDPRNLEAPPRYYPAVVSKGRTGMNRLAERIALMSTFSLADSMGMLTALLYIVADELSQGRIVELGDFGAFRLTIQASGEDDPESVDRYNILEARVQFKPGRPLRDMLKNLEFRKR